MADKPTLNTIRRYHDKDPVVLLEGPHVKRSPGPQATKPDVPWLHKSLL